MYYINDFSVLWSTRASLQKALIMRPAPHVIHLVAPAFQPAPPIIREWSIIKVILNVKTTHLSSFYY